MTISPERLAAYADGELSDAERREIEIAIAADPELARQVAAHQALRSRLSAHFAPILDAPLPERLVAPLGLPDERVIDLAAVREQRERRRRIPRWTWIAGPALAASLVLAIVRPGGDGSDTMVIEGRRYAAGSLAQALDQQLSANQPAGAPTRILLSFKDPSGSYCRGFSGEKRAGIACQDAQGWQLRKLVGASGAPGSEYGQAGSEQTALMAAAQEMAVGGALDAAEERSAQARGWH